MTKRKKEEEIELSVESQDDKDFEITAKYTNQHQAIVCFSQDRNGRLGDALIYIIDEVIPEGCVEQVIKDFADTVAIYYTVIVKVN